MAGVASANPHNQTFAVAIQLGLVGAAVLFAMWLAHLLMFRGPGLAAWVGLVVVTQNIIGSLVNSHLFRFHPWLELCRGRWSGGRVVLANGRRVLKRCSLRQPLLMQSWTRPARRKWRVINHAQTPMPGLEHQHRPERILPVSPAGLVLVETLAHIGDIEQATHLESLLGRSSAAHSLSGPRIHWPSGMPKPCFGRSNSAAGT